MNIVLAPDKFKGSLTGMAFCDAVEEGIHEVLPHAVITKLPLADGGDGTIEILNLHLNGERVHVQVHDPLFRQISASYLFVESTKTAFIEMAEASGMALLSKTEQNCFNTTSLGTGEIILDAINRGAKAIILGVGGSATNDCGIGMASALGYMFLDKNKQEVSPIGKNLSKIDSINTSDVTADLKNVRFKVACDVTNPLYGSNGAAVVYAPQKGASPNEVILLDKGLRHIAKVFLDQFNSDVQRIPGAGAAGGMGAAAVVFLNARVCSGIDLVKELLDFDAKIKNADWIITGEGQLDTQTLSGKTVQGVIDSAKKQNIPVAAFCGSISLDKVSLNNMGISYAASVMEKAHGLQDALQNGYDYLRTISMEFAEKISIG